MIGGSAFRDGEAGLNRRDDDDNNDDDDDGNSGTVS